MSAPRPGPPQRSSRAGRLLAIGLVLLVAVPPAVAADRAGVTLAVAVSPVTVRLDLSAATVMTGTTVGVQAAVTNVSSATIRSVTVTVRFEPVGLVAKGATATRISQLRPGRTSVAAFRLCATAPGAYLVLAQVTVAGATIESPARLLLVTEGRRARC